MYQENIFIGYSRQVGINVCKYSLWEQIFTLSIIHKLHYARLSHLSRAGVSTKILLPRAPPLALSSLLHKCVHGTENYEQSP